MNLIHIKNDIEVLKNTLRGYQQGDGDLCVLFSKESRESLLIVSGKTLLHVDLSFNRPIPGDLKAVVDELGLKLSDVSREERFVAMQASGGEFNFQGQSAITPQQGYQKVKKYQELATVSATPSIPKKGWTVRLFGERKPVVTETGNSSVVSNNPPPVRGRKQ